MPDGLDHPRRRRPGGGSAAAASPGGAAAAVARLRRRLQGPGGGRRAPTRSPRLRPQAQSLVARNPGRERRRPHPGPCRSERRHSRPGARRRLQVRAPLPPVMALRVAATDSSHGPSPHGQLSPPASLSHESVRSGLLGGGRPLRGPAAAAGDGRRLGLNGAWTSI